MIEDDLERLSESLWIHRRKVGIGLTAAAAWIVVMALSTADRTPTQSPSTPSITTTQSPSMPTTTEHVASDAELREMGISVTDVHEIRAFFQQAEANLPAAVGQTCREWNRTMYTSSSSNRTTVLRTFQMYGIMDWYGLTDKKPPSEVDFFVMCSEHPTWTLHQVVTYAYQRYGR